MWGGKRGDLFAVFVKEVVSLHPGIEVLHFLLLY